MAEASKSPMASKTVWVNTLGLAGVVLADAQGWLENADPAKITVGAVVWAVLNIVLRAVTKSPVVFPTKKN